MVPALASTTFRRLMTHTTVGASTGYMSAERGDWPTLVERAVEVSPVAVELSALGGDELPTLVRFLQGAARLPFSFVSLHAPSKRLHDLEAARVDLLLELPPWVRSIVVHPDVIVDAREWRRLGRRLTLENMDERKADGRTSEELEWWFDELPEARLCLDVAHAGSVDPSMSAAMELLDEHRARLSHVHLSSLDDGGHHVSVRPADEARFAPVLDRCTDVPWVLEAPPPS